MERLYYSGKMYLTNLQLFYCCWLVPVRIGLFIIGYLNIAVDLLFLMGISNDTLEPTVLSVQGELFQNVSKPIPVAAYATELGFNVVLLCGLHIKDILLLQVFLYYTIFAVALSFATYSLVLAAVTLQYKLAIIFSTLFQIYCILLVRSELVNMKMKRKMYKYALLKMNSDPSTFSYSNPNYVPKDDTTVIVMGNENVKYTKETDVIDTKHKCDQKEKNVDCKIVNEVEIKSEDGNEKKSLEAEKREARLAKKAEEKRLKEENKRMKEEEKAEEKRIKEEKKAEEIRIREEKKAEEIKIREEKKADEKRIKEEKKAKEKRIKEEKKSEGKRIKHESKSKESTVQEKDKEQVTKDAHETINRDSDSEDSN